MTNPQGRLPSKRRPDGFFTVGLANRRALFFPALIFALVADKAIEVVWSWLRRVLFWGTREFCHPIKRPSCMTCK
jgi:hypothetical protein